MNQVTDNSFQPASAYGNGGDLATRGSMQQQELGRSGAPVRQGDDEINLTDLWYNLLDFKWLALAITVAVTAIGVINAVTSAPVYKADAMLQVETKKGGGLAGLEQLNDVLGQSASSALGELEIIKSRTVMDQVVMRMKLEDVMRPRYFPVIGGWMARRNDDSREPAGAFLGMSSYAWGGERYALERFVVPEAFYDLPFTLVKGEGAAYSLYDPRDTLLAQGVVGQTLKWQFADGTPGELLLSDLQARPGTRFTLSKKHPLSLYNTLVADLTAAEVGKNSNIIRVTYENTSAQFATQFLNELVKAYVGLNVNRRGLEAEQQLRFLDDQLPDVKEQLRQSEEKLNGYVTSRGTVDPSAEGGRLLTANVELEKKRIELQLQRKQLLQKYEPKHPAVQSVDDQLSRLNEESGAVAAETRKLPGTQQEFVRLKRDVLVNQEIYTSLLNRSQQLKVAKAGTVGNVAVVDYAKKPKFPVRPKRGQIVGLALLAGAFLGVLAAQVMAFMRSAIRDPSKLEQSTGLSVFSIVPLSRAQSEAEKTLKHRTDKVGLLAVTVPSDASIEALRSFRTGLQFATIDTPNRRVLITGPVPEIGKSFVSANFAAIMAQAGKRVVLVDADMRKGTMMRYFAEEKAGGEKPKGLSDVIAGEVALDAALIKSEVEGLDVLLSGTVPPNPSELLLNPRFVQLLETLDGRYDYVIIDSPPVLLVGDASVVAQHCSAVFVVTRYGATNVRQVADTQKRLGQVGVRINGLIFNGFMANRGAYYYGYKYGYGKYKDQYGAYGTYGSLPKPAAKGGR